MGFKEMLVMIIGLYSEDHQVPVEQEAKLQQEKTLKEEQWKQEIAAHERERGVILIL